MGAFDEKTKGWKSRAGVALTLWDVFELLIQKSKFAIVLLKFKQEALALLFKHVARDTFFPHIFKKL